MTNWKCKMIVLFTTSSSLASWSRMANRLNWNIYLSVFCVWQLTWSSAVCKTSPKGNRQVYMTILGGGYFAKRSKFTNVHLLIHRWYSPVYNSSQICSCMLERNVTFRFWPTHLTVLTDDSQAYTNMAVPLRSVAPLALSAVNGLVNLPQQNFLVVLHVSFRRLQHRLDLLLTEWTLEGRELLHLCLDLLCIYIKRMRTCQVILLFHDNLRKLLSRS